MGDRSMTGRSKISSAGVAGEGRRQEGREGGEEERERDVRQGSKGWWRFKGGGKGERKRTEPSIIPRISGKSAYSSSSHFFILTGSESRRIKGMPFLMTAQ